MADAALPYGPVLNRVSVAIPSQDGIFEEGLITHHGLACQRALDLLNYVKDRVSVAKNATLKYMPADEKALRQR